MVEAGLRGTCLSLIGQKEGLLAIPTAKELGKVSDFLVSKCQLKGWNLFEILPFPPKTLQHLKLPLLLSTLGKAF